MEAAKGAMETAHSGAAHAAAESIHAMEAASEAVAHEGLADEAGMANEAGLTDEAVTHERTAREAGLTDEAVAHEGLADEAGMANEAGLTDEAATNEGTANEASIDEAVVDEAMVDEKAMVEVAMAVEKERATKTKERAAIERIAVVITLDWVAPIVVTAGVVRVVILGRCRRRAEGGGERACGDGDLEHRNLPFETCG
jgi:hypothetical protein